MGGDPDDAAHVRRVRTHLEALGFFAEIGGGHATDAALVARQLKLAAAVGADVLRTVIGFHGTIEQTIAKTRAAMTEVLPLARRLGVPSRSRITRKSPPPNCVSCLRRSMIR